MTPLVDSLTTHAFLAFTRGGMQAPFVDEIAHHWCAVLLDLPTAGLEYCEFDVRH